MRVIAGRDLSVAGEFEVTEHHQGAPGLAHGGLLAAAFDEVLGALNWLLRVPAVTARLETDFQRPVPVGRILHIDAWIVGTVGRKVYTRAVGRLDGANGDVVLTSHALFVQVSMEHFSSHGRDSDVARAAAERAEEGGHVSTWEINP